MIRTAPLIGLALFLAACGTAGADTNSRIAEERHACAEVGIIPGTPAFADCVGGMDKMMFDYTSRAAR